MVRYLSDLSSLTGLYKIGALLAFALCAHLTVKIIQKVSFHFSRTSQSDRSKTVASLSSSILIFVIYFIAFGITLQELGVSLGTYIASASVIGIAVGFGTQNLVQDLINGLTIILTNQFTVGDMVEISGQTGIVQQISMRFVILLNPLGAQVYIPTRTVTNVINYPRGYIRCLVDINLSSRKDLENFNETFLEKTVKGFTEQFPGILRADPEIQDIRTTTSNKYFIRIKFRIWPGRGAPIETTFKRDVVEALKTINSEITETSVSINYEISN